MTIQKYEPTTKVKNHDYDDGFSIVAVMAHDPDGEWVRYSDIPQPLPWFKRPDSEGWWWFINHELSMVFRLLKTIDGRLVAFETGRCETAYVGLWQRIPAAVPPVEESQ